MVQHLIWFYDDTIYKSLFGVLMMRRCLSAALWGASGIVRRLWRRGSGDPRVLRSKLNSPALRCECHLKMCLLLHLVSQNKSNLNGHIGWGAGIIQNITVIRNPMLDSL
jgi:hypothetical protein